MKLVNEIIKEKIYRLEHEECWANRIIDNIDDSENPKYPEMDEDLIGFLNTGLRGWLGNNLEGMVQEPIRVRETINDGLSRKADAISELNRLTKMGI